MAENYGKTCASKERLAGRPPSAMIGANRETRIKLTGEFNAFRAIEQLNDLMRPAGFYERIVLDFANASQVKPVELYRLFNELSASPRFNHIEIRIEGLQFSYTMGKS